MTPEIKEIKTAYKGLQTLYDIYLPNVDPTLIDDLLMRQQQKENSNAIPFLHDRSIYHARDRL